MDCSTPGLPVHHQLPESTQTHVHRVGDAIQPSYSLSSPSPPDLNHSQHQGLFKWVSSSHQVAKVLEFQLQHQSFQWTPLYLLAVQGTLLLWFLVVNFKQTFYTWSLSLGLIMFWRLGLRRTSCWRIFYEILAWSSASSRMYLDCDWSHTMTQVAFAILIHLLSSSLLRPENVSWLSSKFPLLRYPWFSQERELATSSQLAPD